MTRADYLSAVIDAYLKAPDTPARASRADWAIATSLFNDNVPLENVVHAIRLATLRRQDSGNLGPISSLAYFRRVALRLTKDDLQPFYVTYVNSRFQERTASKISQPSQTATSPPECRGS